MPYHFVDDTGSAGSSLSGFSELLFTVQDREHECCSFLSFSVGIGTGGTTLDITGPPVAVKLIDALV